MEYSWGYGGRTTSEGSTSYVWWHDCRGLQTENENGEVKKVAKPPAPKNFSGHWVQVPRHYPSPGRYYPWGLALRMYTEDPGKHWESYQDYCRYHERS